MRTVGVALLLVATGCGSSDNLVVGFIGDSPITPFIQFDNIGSVINGNAHLFDSSGAPTGNTAEVVIISDVPGLCDRLRDHPDYFRNPPEDYRVLILFYPGTDHLGTFIPGRAGDEGTDSEIIGVKQSPDPNNPQNQIRVVAPFIPPRSSTDLTQPAPVNGPYMTLSDWSPGAGGGSAGTFNLIYIAPPQLNVASTTVFQFTGRFRSAACPTLDGTLLP
jgi:hypothetical protein